MFYKNGEFYFGEWKNDKLDGKGNFFFQNGSHYHGYFKDGMMDGNGYLFSLF